MKQEKFDLAGAMFQNLQPESTHSMKLLSAIDALNKAANLLDNMKENQASEQITNVIEKLAKICS